MERYRPYTSSVLQKVIYAVQNLLSFMETKEERHESLRTRAGTDIFTIDIAGKGKAGAICNRSPYILSVSCRWLHIRITELFYDTFCTPRLVYGGRGGGRELGWGQDFGEVHQIWIKCSLYSDKVTRSITFFPVIWITWMRMVGKEGEVPICFCNHQHSII